MESLKIDRTACNTFTFTYTDIVNDLQIDIYTMELNGTWSGNFADLPIYTTFVIPHRVYPDLEPVVVSLSLPSDKIYVFKYTGIIPNYEWYLPSREALQLISTVIGSDDQYNIIPGYYWSSSEADIKNPLTDVWCQHLIVPGNFIKAKTEELNIIIVKSYNTNTNYEIGDYDVNNNIIYNKQVNESDYTYQVCKTLNGVSTWSTITNANANTVDIINGDIQQSKINTNLMLVQSSTPLDLANIAHSYWDTIIRDSEYSVYTIFCDLIQCRLNIIKRVLGELDNCKDECDCINVYDFNAFNAIYESILNLYEDLFSSLNINATNSIISASELDKFTTLNILLQQYKKYCIECKTPCKNC